MATPTPTRTLQIAALTARVADLCLKFNPNHDPHGRFAEGGAGGGAGGGPDHSPAPAHHEHEHEAGSPEHADRLARTLQDHPDPAGQIARELAHPGQDDREVAGWVKEHREDWAGIRHDQAAEVKDQAADHRRAVKELDRDHATERRDLEREQAAEVKDQIREHRDAGRALARDQQDRQAELDREHREAGPDADAAEQAAERAQMARDHQADREEQAATHTLEREQLAEEHARARTEQAEAHRVEREQLAEEHAQEVRELHDQHAQDRLDALADMVLDFHGSFAPDAGKAVAIKGRAPHPPGPAPDPAEAPLVDEKVLKRALKRWFKKVAEHVLGTLPDNLAAVPTVFPKLADYADAMASAMTPVLTHYWDKAGKHVRSSIGLDPDGWKVVSPYLHAKIQQQAMNFCTSTLDTTQLAVEDAYARLREELDTGMVEVGETSEELTRRVQSVFTDASKVKAEQIARTESHRAWNAAGLEAAQQSGVVKGKQWLASEGACEECHRHADKGHIPLDAAFATGLSDKPEYATCDAPPLHPWCRCTLTWELTDEWQKVVDEAEGKIPTGTGPLAPTPKPKPKPQPKPKPAPAPPAPAPGPAYSTPPEVEPDWSGPPGRPSPQHPDPQSLVSQFLALPPDLDMNELMGIDLHATPEWGPADKSKKLSYGGVLVNDKGQVLLREPVNHFGGAAWTFAKGKHEPGEHPLETATREVKEETGHKAAVLGLVPGKGVGTTGETYYFLMRSTGENPAWMDGETAQTKWVSWEEAKKLIEQSDPVVRARDLKVLEAARAQLAKLASDPHANDHLLHAPPKPVPAPAPTPAPAPAPAPVAAHTPGPLVVPDLSDLTEIRPLGGHGGGNATLCVDSSGKYWVRKEGRLNPGQLREEVIADAAYAALGVGVPRSAMVDRGGDLWKLAEYHEGKSLGQLIRSDPAAASAAMAKVRKHFVVDCLLGNWDVVGASFDNILVTPDGRVLRIDNGGALRYRAQGTLKRSQWGRTVGELQSLRDPSVNVNSAKVFGSITDKEVLEQIKAITPAREAALLAALPPDVRPMVQERLAYLRQYALSLGPPASAPPVPATWTPTPASAFKRFQAHASDIDAWAGPAFHGWGQTLTPDEHAAIGNYTGPGHRSMNKQLRKGTMPRTAKVLKQALDRARLPEAVEAYRGIGKLSDIPGVSQATLHVGQVIEDPAFISASLDPGRAFSGTCEFTIRYPAGAPAAYVNVSPSSSVRGEKELLLSARTGRYRVVEFSTVGSRDHVTLEWVPK